MSYTPERLVLHCPDCIKDSTIFCPRNVDGRCLECGAELYASHLMEHFRKVHCMSLTLDHCREALAALWDEYGAGRQDILNARDPGGYEGVQAAWRMAKTALGKE